jgi:hypothetical protein
MKKILGLFAVTVLLLSACGGSDTTNSAAYGDDNNKASRAPANDKFSTAESVSRVPFNKTATTTGATVESSEPRPCGDIDNTVWYRFIPSSDINVRAKATASFNTVIAAYSGTDMTALTEVGCGTTGTATEFQFGAMEGETYYIQVGSADGSEGSITFGLVNANQAQLLLGDPGPVLPGWTEKTLIENTAVTTPAVGPVDLDLVTIDGAPRATDKKWYDITLTAAGTPVQTIGLKTEGVLTQPIHLELVQITKEAAKVSLQLTYRFDPRKTDCRLELGGTCMVRLPIDPTDVNWTTERGPAAELILLAGVTVGNTDINGNAVDVGVPDPLYIRIPLIGQVTSIGP